MSDFSPLVLRKESFDNEEEITLFVSAESFKVVHVGSQNNKSTIWYETVKEPITKQTVHFMRVRSGSEVPAYSSHVGVSRIDYENWGGEVFWHIYQIYK